MRNIKLLYILTIFHFLVSCSTRVNEESVPEDLALLLTEAEDLRFRKPELVEAMMANCRDSIMNSDNPHLPAQYYFISAHVEMARGHFDQANLMVDSMYAFPSFVAQYADKINLMYALMYEKRLMYEPAYGFYKALTKSRKTPKLNSEEQLIALLGQARIQYWLKADYKTTYSLAETFVASHPELDVCLLHYNGVLLDSSDKRFFHLKQGEQCALEHGCHYLLLQCYIQHAVFSQEADTIGQYLSLVEECVGKYGLASMYKGTQIEASYLEIKSKWWHAQGQYAESMRLAQQGIALAETLQMPDKAYRLCLLLSDMQFSMKHYDQAMLSKDKAMDYRLAYSQQVNGDKMKVIEAQEQADRLLVETKSKTFQLRLYLGYSIIVSLIIYLLYINRKKLNEMLSSTKRKMQVKDTMHERYVERNEARIQQTMAEIHRKEKLLKDKQVRLEEISSLVKESPFKDKSKLNKIEDVVSAEHEVESWDLFYEDYQYKYPHGENALRQAFPSLSPKDYKYLMCIHYGLSHDKIAVLFSIKPDSVRKRCFRLKANFGISRNTDIKSYVLSHILD